MITGDFSRRIWIGKFCEEQQWIEVWLQCPIFQWSSWKLHRGLTMELHVGLTFPLDTFRFLKWYWGFLFPPVPYTIVLRDPIRLKLPTGHLGDNIFSQHNFQRRRIVLLLGHWIATQEAYVQFPALTQTSGVTLGKPLNLPIPLLNGENNNISLICLVYLDVNFWQWLCIAGVCGEPSTLGLWSWSEPLGTTEIQYKELEYNIVKEKNCPPEKRNPLL